MTRTSLPYFSPFFNIPATGPGGPPPTTSRPPPTTGRPPPTTSRPPPTTGRPPPTTSRPPPTTGRPGSNQPTGELISCYSISLDDAP